MPITIDTTTITLRNSWLSHRLSLADGTAYTSELLLRPIGNLEKLFAQNNCIPLMTRCTPRDIYEVKTSISM